MARRAAVPRPESFVDPALAQGSDEERLEVSRQVRDQIKERSLALGPDSVPIISSAAFGEQIEADVAKWAKIIRDADIRTE